MRKVVAYLFASDRRYLVDLVLKEEILETRLVSHFHINARFLGLQAKCDPPKGEQLLFCGLRATEHTNAGVKANKVHCRFDNHHNNFIPTF